MKLRGNMMSPMKPIFYHLRGEFRTGIIPMILVLLTLGIFTISEAASQELNAYFENTAPDKYRVTFTDKNNTGYSIDKPGEFLSPASIERRQKQGIHVTEADLPVNPAYVNQLREYGATVLNVSKWFNSATIEVSDSTILERIASLPFINNQTALKKTTGESPEFIAQTMEITDFDESDYGNSWLQIAVHNGHYLHRAGFTGEGITIAVLDAGFSNADTLSFFNRLFENDLILGTRDFVEPGNDVYREATHGMSVLSIIGGYSSEELIGTAPDAAFWLLRTEDGRSEYIIEEDNWISAAEFADSAGAYVINTSLGYSVFNDTLQNHVYTDMDGNTTRVSRAADMAAARGMMVIVSAGNQGNSKWKYITAPADGDSILTVGAVDRSGVIATFSSRGPSSDGEVKPNVVSIGQGVYVGNVDGNIRPGNGTSYSAPVITGLTACLWQANPDAKAREIFQAIIESSDRYNNPDYEYGYGLPDFHLANMLLKAKKQTTEPNTRITAFPNPFSDQLFIFFSEAVDSPVNIRLFDIAGKQLFQKTYPALTDRYYLVIENEFTILRKGVYIIRIEAGKLSGNSKLIKY